MGCTASRLDTEGSDMSGKSRPVLRRRLDEMLSRRSNKNLMKKQLLRDAPEDQPSEDSSEGSIKFAQVAPETEQDKIVNETDKGHSNKKDEKIMDVEFLEGEEDDDESRSSGFEGPLICPRSPSFRVYCVHEPFSDSKDDKLDQDDDMKFGNASKKSDTEESNVLPTSDEGSDSEKPKKEKRGRKFKRAIMKASGKHFMNVKSCYTPACGGGQHEKTRLLSAKQAS
ncbi:hypothetical protein ACFE04_028969 [Oxalis oulophora]